MYVSSPTGSSASLVVRPRSYAGSHGCNVALGTKRIIARSQLETPFSWPSIKCGN